MLFIYAMLHRFSNNISFIISCVLLSPCLFLLLHNRTSVSKESLQILVFYTELVEPQAKTTRFGSEKKLGYRTLRNPTEG